MSERPIHDTVALRDRASGRYLSMAATWSDDVADAVLLGEDEARSVRRRFLCEPGAVELVRVECRAVA